MLLSGSGVGGASFRSMRTESKNGSGMVSSGSESLGGGTGGPHLEGSTRRPPLCAMWIADSSSCEQRGVDECNGNSRR